MLFFSGTKLLGPKQTCLNVIGGADEDFLVREGILERPFYKFPIPDTLDEVSRIVHAHSFWDLEQRNPGCWALAQGAESDLQRRGLLLPNKGAYVELSCAIPVPDIDVAFEDILSFKLKRAAELLVLREELDIINARVISSSDPNSELSDSVFRIDKACADLIKVGREWQFPVKLTTQKISFELRPLVSLAAGTTAFSAASTYAMPLTGSILAGIGGALIATTPCIKIGADFGWRGLKPRLGPYRYVYSYHREVF